MSEKHEFLIAGNSHKGKSPRAVTFRNATILRVFSWALLFVALATLAVLGRQVIMLTFAGILLGVALAGCADWLCQKTKIARGWCLGLVCVLLLGLTLGGLWGLGSQVGKQVGELTKAVPESAGKLRDRIREHPMGAQLAGPAKKAEEAGQQQMQQLPAKAGRAVVQMVNVAGGVVLLFFLGIFFAATPAAYRKGFLHLVPLPKRPKAEEVLDQIGRTLRRWLLGLVVAMVSATVLTGIALWLLKVPMALTLALLAGVGEIVPNFGPLAAAVPAILLSLVDSPARAGLVVLAYIVIQTVQSYLITPIIQDKAVHMPPAVQIVMQVLLGTALGPLGLIIATPLVAVVMVLIRMLYVRDTLGDASIEKDLQPDT